MNFPIRPAESTDRAYIIKSWVTSLRRQFPFSAMGRDAIAKYSQRVDALMDIAPTLVACDPKMPDVIYGFVCYEVGLYLGREDPTLHYIWTRKKFQENGIAHSLLSATGMLGKSITYTHITRDLERKRLYEKWRLETYDPYLIEGAIYAKAKCLDAKAVYRQEGIGLAASSNPLQFPSHSPAGKNYQHGAEGAGDRGHQD